MQRSCNGHSILSARDFASRWNCARNQPKNGPNKKNETDQALATLRALAPAALARVDAVVAVGGDGTLAEVAQCNIWQCSTVQCGVMQRNAM